MATARSYLKCDVCGSITLLRTQLGWLNSHPIRIHCGKCNILISGKALLNPQNGTFRFEFQNAQNVVEVAPDYYVEASGELLTPKPRPYTGPFPPVFPPSFFHAGIWAMGDERFLEFKRRVVSFLAKVQDWPKVRRINELWRDGNYQYLAQEVHRYLKINQFPMSNELEYLRGVHQMNILFFGAILDDRRFSQNTDWLFKEISDMHKTDAEGVRNLALHFGDSGLLARYEAKLLDRMEQFIDRFQFMLPVFGLQFYDQIPPDLANKKGITTASFEDLKPFYLDSYEVAADILRLILAYNNLKHRHDFNAMAPRRTDVKSLMDWDAKPKGTRVGYLNGSEAFDRLVNPSLNNQLRNAIGHNSYQYLGAVQELLYFPNGTENQSESCRMQFLEFVQLCWGMFLTIMDLAELVYQTRKIYLMAKGHAPHVRLDAFLPGPMNRAQRRAQARKIRRGK